MRKARCLYATFNWAKKYNPPSAPCWQVRTHLAAQCSYQRMLVHRVPWLLLLLLCSCCCKGTALLLRLLLLLRFLLLLWLLL